MSMSCRKINDVIRELITDTDETSLIIVLGVLPRKYIETEIKTLLTDSKQSESNSLTVEGIRHLHKDIKVLFLNQLQYLFMYLTNLEVENGSGQEKTLAYNNIILYGLDQLMLDAITYSDVEVARVGQLIINSLYSLRRYHDNINRLISIPYRQMEAKDKIDDEEDTDRTSRVNKIMSQLNNYCEYLNGQNSR